MGSVAVDQLPKVLLPPRVTHAETLYLFGDNDRVAWSELFSAYKLPPYSLPGMAAELSFGIAGEACCCEEQ